MKPHQQSQESANPSKSKEKKPAAQSDRSRVPVGKGMSKAPAAVKQSEKPKTGERLHPSDTKPGAAGFVSGRKRLSANQ